MNRTSSELSPRLLTAGFLFLLVAAMVAWGGCWSAAKVVAARTTPVVLSFWRFIFTSVAVLAVFPFFGEPLRVHRRELLRMLPGAGMMVLYNLLFFEGLKTGLAGAGGVLVGSLSPLSIFVVTSVRSRTLPGRWQAAGLLGGLIGSFIFLRLWAVSWEELATGGNLLFLVCALLWGCMTMYSQWAQARVSFLAYSFYQYGLSTLLMLPLALISVGAGGLLPAGGMDALLWLNLGYLAVLGTAFSTTVYFLASKKLGSRTAGSFMFLVPVSAVALSWMLLGEIPALNTIVGGSLMTAAVYLINRMRRAS